MNVSSNTKFDLRAAQKRKQFEEWMKGDHVLLHLDSRRPGVEVPPGLVGNPAVTLKLSYLFQGETKHDDASVTAYLRFGANYERCIIAWDAVWGMTSSDKENRIWEQDLPKELLVPNEAVSTLKNIGQKLFGLGKRQGKDAAEAKSEPAARPEAAALEAAEPATVAAVPPPPAAEQAPQDSATKRSAVLRRVK